ncbi:hypothetical protein DVA67_001290 [Solirubrobacter sp. CPCC 204708]|uniref:STAS domain-containing protein n=1 Tax=Solirubrobacter deserti TaxID=2282478 RepID=A0ABT4RDZ8_9ACTN|nr:hypothetical protein [Solirubrobacter deserti]MBE2314592.1 hypothetical protein [Solirubrobacter deserti]MDA0136596.1 hypothetical protein [Solirubrobacter deserti]
MILAPRHREVETWHRVDSAACPALARTKVTVTGVLDLSAVEAIDDAVQSAEASGHELTFDLSHISTITAGALDELLSRGHQPRSAKP